MITKQQRLDYLRRMKQFCQLLESEPPPRVCRLLDWWYLIYPPQTPEFEDVQAIRLDLQDPGAGWRFSGLIHRSEEEMADWDFYIPKQYQFVQQALEELPEIARQFEAMVDRAMEKEQSYE